MTIQDIKDFLVSQNRDDIVYESELHGSKIIVIDNKTSAAVFRERPYSKDIYLAKYFHSAEEAIEFVENLKKGKKQPDNVYSIPIDKIKPFTDLKCEEIISPELYEKIQNKLKKDEQHLK